MVLIIFSSGLFFILVEAFNFKIKTMTTLFSLCMRQKRRIDFAYAQKRSSGRRHFITINVAKTVIVLKIPLGSVYDYRQCEAKFVGIQLVNILFSPAQFPENHLKIFLNIKGSPVKIF